MQIALDGPAGAGKSTIAKKLAKRLGFLYVDTGAMYRGVALYFHQNNLPYQQEEEVRKQLCHIQIRIARENQEQILFLNGKNVNDKIRQNHISMISSTISAYPCVRLFLLDQQRQLAQECDVIMDGRDIGTVVLPQADLKLFLTASVKKRAIRRHWQLKGKGIYKSVNELMKEIKQRDRQDSTREIAPLKMAPDAILIDNSNLNLSQSLRKIIELVEGKN